MKRVRFLDWTQQISGQRTVERDQEVHGKHHWEYISYQLQSNIVWPIFGHNYLRFWCVERFGGVTNILSRVENSERESGQEIAWRQQTSYRSQSETGCSCQKIGNILQLGYIITCITAVLFEQREDGIELFTGASFIQILQLVINCRPSCLFRVTIIILISFIGDKLFNSGYCMKY